MIPSAACEDIAETHLKEELNEKLTLCASHRSGEYCQIQFCLSLSYLQKLLFLPSSS